MGGTSVGAQLWNCDTDETKLSTLSKPGPVAFSDDGTPLQFVAESHGNFLLWDIARNKGAQEFRIADLSAPGSWPEFAAVPMAVTPDASRVAGAACLRDGAGRYAAWDAKSGRLLLQDDRKIFSLGFTPDGSLLAAGDNNGSIVVWSVAAAEKIATLKDDRLSIRSLAFHRDSLRHGEKNEKADWLLAAGDEGGTITIWDLSAKKVRMRLLGSPYHVYAITFSPDGTILASAGRYGATLWDVATGRPLLRLRAGNFQTNLDFSSDGRRLAIASKAAWDDQGNVFVYDLEDGRGIRTLRGLAGQVSMVWISADQKWLAGLAHNWRLGIWEITTGRLRHVIEVPKGEIGANAFLEFDCDGRRLVFHSAENASLWDIESGRQLHLWHAEAPVIGFAFNESNHLRQFELIPAAGHMSAAGKAEESWSLIIRDAISQELIKCVTAFGAADISPSGLLRAFHGGNHLIVVAVQKKAENRTILIKAFNGLNGAEKWRLAYDSDAVCPENPLCEVPGRFLVYWASADQPPHLVDCDTGAQVGLLQQWPVALSPAGDHWICNLSAQSGSTRRLAICGRGGETPLFVLPIEQSGADNVPRFSSDGNLFAWGNADGTVSLCNLPEVREHLAMLGMAW